MVRQCEICGGIESDEVETSDASSPSVFAVDLLFVCGQCRLEREG